MKMKEVLVLGASIFLFDTMLTLALWTGLVLLQCSTCGGLTAVWAFGVLKWVILHHFTLILTDGKTQTVLSRLVVLLCLLSPVFESGWSLVAPPSEPHLGPSPDISMLLLGPTCSLLACVVWEIGLCADGKMKNNELDTTQLLLRMLNYFKPDTLYVIAAFSFLTLAVVCDTLIPWYQGKVIDMLKAEALESSFCYSVGQLALISVGSALFSGLRGGMFMCTLSRLNRRLKHLLFHTLLQQEVHFFVENSPGHLSSRLHCDIAKMGCTIALNANALVRSTMKTFLTLTLMLHLSWELTVLTCIEIPLVAIMQKKYISLSSELKMKIQECQAQTEGLALQTFTRIRVVRSFKGEKEEVRRYAEAVNHMHSLKRRKQLYGVMYGLIRTMVSLGIKVFMLLQAHSLISSGRLTTGTLVSFFLYQKPLSRSSNEILHSYGDTMSTVGIISTVFGYLDRKPEGKEQGELAPEKLEGRIVFQNVTFSYPSASADKTALKSISLEIAAGKITALVGPSGSGKSSCISLIKRFYEPQEGQILLDGKPLHYYKSKYLHQKVAVVSQDLELFSGSLRYNIEYGLKGCTIEKVREAAKKANAEAVIPELKNEYDKDLGGCGITFSCGQQYCIGLLRALVRHPQVIILDETTSKVDAEVWNAVLQEVLSVGGTVLMVAHNLESVKMLDHIIFIEDGEVAEEGTHQELMAMNGRYYQFYQNSSFTKRIVEN